METDSNHLSRGKQKSFSISNHLLMKEAERRGWETKIIDYEKDLIAFFPTRNDPQSMLLFQRSTSELSTALGLILANDKMLTYRMAAYFDVPVPISLLYTPHRESFPDELVAFLNQHHRVVVKPTDGAYGDGVTTNVTDIDSMQKAIENAQQFSSNILIQPYVSGNDYRILVLNGRTIAATWRQIPFVVGDGIRKIRQLIELKNTHPCRGNQQDKHLKYINIDEVRAYIGTEQLETVPEIGCEVQVIGVASISRGGESRDVTESIHPSIRRMAEKISNGCQLGLCGVDMIIAGDITKPIGPACQATLIEINAAPGLRMHHFPSDGGFARNVSGAVLDELVRRRTLSISTSTTGTTDSDGTQYFAKILSNPEEFSSLSIGEEEFYATALVN